MAGAGSGGTYSGILKYLKEKDPNIKGVLADPIGSTMGGGEHGDYNIEGIGNDFIADTMDMRLVDQVIKINDADAFEGFQISCISSRASSRVLHPEQHSRRQRKLAASGAIGNVVVVFPDRGDRYFSKGLFK